MRVLSIAIILLSFSVHAEKQMTAKDMSVLGKIDESTLNKVQESKPMPETKSASSNFLMSCKDRTGKEFKQGDAGYESCVAGIKLMQNQDNKKNGMSNRKSDNGNKANLNFKIGE